MSTIKILETKIKNTTDSDTQHLCNYLIEKMQLLSEKEKISIIIRTEKSLNRKLDDLCIQHANSSYQLFDDSDKEQHEKITNDVNVCEKLINYIDLLYQQHFI